MPYRSFEGQNCSIARALEILGERWTLLVLREVLLGPPRFAAIRRNTGVATNILTDRLATLVEHDVLERREDEHVPTRKAIDANPGLRALLPCRDAHAPPGSRRCPPGGAPPPPPGAPPGASSTRRVGATTRTRSCSARTARRRSAP